MRITAAQTRHYFEHGYVVIPKFLTPAELRKGRAGMARYFPSVTELEATPERYGFIYDDPENLQVEFPFADDNLNDIATHPVLIAFVQSILGTGDIRLSQ